MADLHGLTDAEAERRLRTEGLNELGSSKPRGILPIALEVAREPMFLLLVAAGSVYLAIGSLGDALMLLGFVFVVMALTVIQERRTERALEALRDLSSPRALVIRSGSRKRISGLQVVRGDILVLAEGDRVPADALFRRGAGVCVDESLLTGESVPVRKAPSGQALEMDNPGGDDSASLFAGTVFTAGQAVAEVIATGPHTALGRIGRALEAIESTPTPLERETRTIVRKMAVVGLTACALVAAGYGLTRGADWPAWRQGLLAGIAMAMAVLPEEFPVVLTVFLALGAWRISRSRVLTRRMPVIETLGAATVLCVDKTGTLTENRMALSALASGTSELELTDDVRVAPADSAEVLQVAVLASKPDPFDPMERALHDAAERLLPEAQLLHRQWSLTREYPLTPGFPVMSQLWQRGTSGELIVASKGAPEAIAELCHLDSEARAGLLSRVRELAGRGLRVLAVARAEIATPVPSADPSSLTAELLGLVGFTDPLRESVRAAVAECRSAGIRIVMITGDYPETARTIARQAGLAGSHAVIGGAELRAMSDAELAARIRSINIFARVVPEQKLRIVNALQANGEVVAMTGDGVNDAPALKAAHIGIAMGARGTDVAREAASLVLLNDDFSSIVTAVKLGRRIFDNIKKAAAFVLAVHVPIAGLSMVPVFLTGWPLLLLPVHIVFLELVIDPSCSLIFEAEEAEADIMRRPPRRAGEGIFSMRTVVLAVLEGLSVLAACLLVFMLTRIDHGADAARALTFSTLVVGLLMIILINRSWNRSLLKSIRLPNRALWWVLAGTGAALATILYVPALQRRFFFAALHADDLVLSLMAGAVCLCWCELLKRRVKVQASSGQTDRRPNAR